MQLEPVRSLTDAELRGYAAAGRIAGTRPLHAATVPTDAVVSGLWNPYFAQSIVRSQADRLGRILLPLWALRDSSAEPGWLVRFCQRIIAEIVPMALESYVESAKSSGKYSQSLAERMAVKKAAALCREAALPYLRDDYLRAIRYAVNCTRQTTAHFAHHAALSAMNGLTALTEVECAAQCARAVVCAEQAMQFGQSRHDGGNALLTLAVRILIECQHPPTDTVRWSSDPFDFGASIE